METPKTLYAKTPDGLYIAYQDVGSGPDTLVLVNGMYSHIEVYWEWAQFGRTLADRSLEDRDVDGQRQRIRLGDLELDREE